MGKWVVDYIQKVFLLLFKITANTETNIRLHSQAHSDFLSQHHVELTNLSFTKPQAFSDLETSSPGDGLSGNKSSTIPGTWSLKWPSIETSKSWVIL